MVKVKNIPGTSDKQPPSGFSSWKQYYESIKGIDASKAIGEKESNIVGGHVRKVKGDDKHMYIVPLTRAQNNSNEPFNVDLPLAPIPSNLNKSKRKPRK